MESHADGADLVTPFLGYFRSLSSFFIERLISLCFPHR